MKIVEKEINLDMDGTFVNLYGVEDWLDDLTNGKTRPYEIAEPLVNMSVFARYLNILKAKGYRIKIISWTSKRGTKEYNERIAVAKRKWLKVHLPSVNFDKIDILPYGSPKQNYGNGYLFDDEEHNRTEWNGIAYTETELMSTLKALCKG